MRSVGEAFFCCGNKKPRVTEISATQDLAKKLKTFLRDKNNILFQTKTD
jgi:hypothetical protein